LIPGISIAWPFRIRVCFAQSPNGAGLIPLFISCSTVPDPWCAESTWPAKPAMRSPLPLRPPESMLQSPPFPALNFLTDLTPQCPLLSGTGRRCTPPSTWGLLEVHPWESRCGGSCRTCSPSQKGENSSWSSPMGIRTQRTAQTRQSSKGYLRVLRSTESGSQARLSCRCCPEEALS